MHGAGSYEQFLQDISVFLGSYYLFMVIMNACVAFYVWQSGKDRELFRLPGFNVPVTESVAWLMLTMVFVVMSPIAYSAHPEWIKSISLPQSLRDSSFARLLPTSV